MKLSLVIYPDTRLRETCSPVESFNGELRELTDAMLQFMIERNGVGLAGPQVGIIQRLFVCNITGEPDDNQVYINPELVDLVGAAEGEEGCLSIPGINVPVRRAERATIRAYDVEGNPIEHTAEGLLARVWQHETDHLDGGLILDRTTPTAKLTLRRTLRDLETRHTPARSPAR